MRKERIKVYTYTRVSTAMQTDGYSLDAQKARMKAYAEFNDYEIAHEYEDAGKSGKSIEGRVQFNQMMEDIQSGKDGVSKYLADHGIRKIPRQNGKNPLFDSHLVRMILRNPVYCGKIAYGRRKTEKVHGTRNDYHLVEQDDYLLVDGLHEPIVSEEVWQEAQVKLIAQARKYEHVNKPKNERTHLLSGIVKCPVCGAGMYGNKSIKHKKDGTKYKDFYYYGCKHRKMIDGHKCDYKKQVHEELLDNAVAEVIAKLVSNPKFAAMIQQKIHMQVDTSAIDQEIHFYNTGRYQKQLKCMTPMEFHAAA